MVTSPPVIGSLPPVVVHELKFDRSLRIGIDLESILALHIDPVGRLLLLLRLLSRLATDVFFGSIPTETCFLCFHLGAQLLACCFYLPEISILYQDRSTCHLDERVMACDSEAQPSNLDASNISNDNTFTKRV